MPIYVRLLKRLLTATIKNKSNTSSKKAAAEPVGKTLRSAVANAQDRSQDEGDLLDVDDLIVQAAFVDEGATLRRWRARAQGRASPIRKRTSHITVIVDTRDT